MRSALAVLVVALAIVSKISAEEEPPAPTKAARTLPTFPLCTRVNGITGEYQTTFIVVPNYMVRAGEALVFQVTPLGAEQPVANHLLLNVTHETSRGSAVSLLGDEFGQVVMTSAFLFNTEFIVTVTGPTPASRLGFQFVAFAANAPVCFIEIPNGGNYWGTLPKVSGKIASMYFVFPPSGSVPFTQVHITSDKAVALHYGVREDVSVSDNMGTIADGTAKRWLHPGETMYGVIASSKSDADRSFLLTADWGHPPPGSHPDYDTGSKGDDQHKGLISIAVDRSELPSMFSVLLYGVVAYFVIGSIMNYRNGETQFPDYVPHHEFFRSLLAKSANVAGNVRDRAREGYTTISSKYNHPV